MSPSIHPRPRSIILVLAIIAASWTSGAPSVHAQTPDSVEAQAADSIEREERAREPGVARAVGFEGTFARDSAAGDDVKAAIDATVSEMNFLIRGFARGRLESTNEPYRTITITNDTSSVSVATDDRAPVTAPATGDSIRWEREDGEELVVRMRWEDGELRQTFTAEDGLRRNVYRLAPDGRTLTLDVTVESGRLPEPLTYQLVYDRVE